MSHSLATSTEFLDAARRRLAGAEAVARHDPSTALSAAYYDARAASPEQAREAVRLAEEFLDAVARLLD